VGEFGLIARITARLGSARLGSARLGSARLGSAPATLVGPGDDAAVLAAPDGRVVATTDLLVEGRHFRCEWSSAYDVGRKAAAQNLADVAAMGAAPTGLLVGLACPADLPLDWADGLADGLRDECAVAGCAVVGGDVVGSALLTVAVSALGDLQGRAPVLRSGAQVGDVVCVVGALGGAAAGLAVLQAGAEPGRVHPTKAADPTKAAARHPGAVAAHRRPCPPYAAGVLAAVVGATAMVDVSDGLLADLGHVAVASGVAIALDPAAVPRHVEVAAVAVELGLRVDDLVLTGGEDHALALTAPPAVAATLLGALAGWPEPVPGAVVGRVDAGAGVRLTDGATTAGRGGYDHFASSGGS
jgi:thiamine-monophosphate kinase